MGWGVDSSKSSSWKDCVDAGQQVIDKSWFESYCNPVGIGGKNAVQATKQISAQKALKWEVTMLMEMDRSDSSLGHLCPQQFQSLPLSFTRI